MYTYKRDIAVVSILSSVSYVNKYPFSFTAGGESGGGSHGAHEVPARLPSKGSGKGFVPSHLTMHTCV